MSVSELLNERLCRIRMLITDVDGVMTDGKMIVDKDGNYIKNFNAHDGFGLSLARKAGLKLAIITAKEAPATRARAADLGFDTVLMNDTKKITSFHELCTTFSLAPEACVYVGDDWLDVPVIRAAGIGIAVANARPEVRDAADYITQATGGNGALREVVELILDAQNKLERP